MEDAMAVILSADENLRTEIAPIPCSFKVNAHQVEQVYVDAWPGHMINDIFRASQEAGTSLYSGLSFWGPLTTDTCTIHRPALRRHCFIGA